MVNFKGLKNEKVKDKDLTFMSSMLVFVYHATEKSNVVVFPVLSICCCFSGSRTSNQMFSTVVPSQDT